MLSKIVIVALALLAVLAFVALRSGGNISGEDARAAVADGAILLDVRTPEEFAAGHVEGALNIPVDELAQRIDELGGPTDGVVV